MMIARLLFYEGSQGTIEKKNSFFYLKKKESNPRCAAHDDDKWVTLKGGLC